MIDRRVAGKDTRNMSKSTRLTRRRFLKRASAFAAAPYVITSTALGAPGRLPASERITMGHIGVGGMGGGHLGICGSSEVQTLAVCDVDRRHRERAAARVEKTYARQKASGTYKGCAAYNDFRELLARDDIDAVIIATPDHWHALCAIAAAKAGMDVYCEKPLSLTVREARAMVDAARRYGRVFQTGSQQRSGGRERLGCELVRSGRIGKVREVYVSVGGPSAEWSLPPEPVPEWMDWDFWVGPAAWRCYNRKYHPGSWRGCRDFSGGQMTDWGAHHFDIAQWALGMDASGPVEIIPPGQGREPDLLTYVYANGVRMYHGRGPRGRAIQIFGDRGVVMIDRGGLSTDPPEIMAEPIAPDEVHLYRSHGGHKGDWLRCIRRRSRPVADVEIGCRSVTVCHLGNIAYWLKRPLKWDPGREVFLGDEEANRWLDRPKRAPWRT